MRKGFASQCPYGTVDDIPLYPRSLLSYLVYIEQGMSIINDCVEYVGVENFQYACDIACKAIMDQEKG